MTRFWKHKSEKPLVWNYYGWYYSVEYYGVTHTFIDVEKLREYGNEVAERKRRGCRYSRPIWSKWGFVARMYNLQVRYIHFRYREQIVKLFDQAYKQFSSEQNG